VIEARDHIDKAGGLLEQARYLLNGGFTDGAGRDAYMAGFHAALAFIMQQTGQEPKTHSGARSEFARLARDDERLDRAFTTFLGRGFSLKVAADYDDGEPITADEARAALDQAARFVETVSALISSEPGGA
jgi:uncharacterized protein (UPF0332 family)